MSTVAAERPAAPRLLLAALLGAAVAVALGVYGKVHDPSQKLVFTLFFSSTISMKVWLATFAIGFGVVQALSASWLYGKLPGTVPAWLGGAHRISGRIAFLITLPVAYHCLWSLGFQDTTTRVLVHSLLGCVFYGAFAAKVTIVRAKGLPGFALPVAGGLLFALLVGPEVVAEDKGKPAGAAAYAGGAGGGAPDGKQVFTANCGSCHTLAKAGTSGSVGPNLDDVGLDAEQVQAIVRSGAGVMPSFSDKLSDAEITAVAAYVSGP